MYVDKDPGEKVRVCSGSFKGLESDGAEAHLEFAGRKMLLCLWGPLSPLIFMAIFGAACIVFLRDYDWKYSLLIVVLIGICVIGICLVKAIEKLSKKHPLPCD